MKIYVAKKTTGTFIEEVFSLDTARSLIAEYEAEDILSGEFEDNFYDIVNEDHAPVTTKFAVIRTSDDTFDELFDTLDAALKQAEYNWRHLTDSEKRKCEDFCVAEVIVDEEGCIDFGFGYTAIKNFLAED